ncbi:hypothetical protein GO755_11015 [Spirosoma sp. HMF4905]|uniref:Uncharacterized protein n=1 Tax=Spirosoma arboris TaxID=2682092 RepID=A0A7K1S9Q4_9BACT|nr:hypothetical protein [Spirosoma arboris]MVM30564.1 hypothetical protein [Spirosoma arboris]
MKTLTIDIPDSLDPAVARWEMARALYEKGSLTLEQAASLAELAPTYFKMRLAGMLTGVNLSTSNSPAKPFDPERIRQIAEKMDIQESWEELVAMIGK